MFFKGKNILVIGMARSGLAAVDVLVKRGAVVTIADSKKSEEMENIADYLDKKGIEVYVGEYPPVTKHSFDMIVASPGVPLDIEPVKSAYKEGISVIGEIELAYLLKPQKVEMYAITGTNGKTTTTSLLQAILKRDGRNAVSGGNIGFPLTILVDSMDRGVISVEVSSFQLEATETFKPHICGILNITPDHLDRHKTMEAYIAAKAKIFSNQNENDFVVLNYEDNIVRGFAGQCRSKVVFFSTDRKLNEGVFISNDTIIAHLNGNTTKICSIKDISLRGRHNLENILCAVAISVLAGVKAEVIKETLQSFTGVRHRMEEVLEVAGVLYVNDSKATNPESAIKALESFSEPVILIAGGRNKGSQFGDFAAIVKKRVRELILLGEAREEIKRAVMDIGFQNIHEVEDIESAVFKAGNMARSGDVVLLSPACASWDMFKSYEHRGDCFCDAVQSLARCK